MPYPTNLEVAKQVEQTVRENGAVPATIAVIKGMIKVGLTAEDLLTLAVSSSSEKAKEKVVKASTRDLPYICTKQSSASTTVASTMRIAHEVGINIFATGGIGGVHRGVASTYDISADLLELSRTPVMVVCAGVKSILDVPKTLEVLETNSVPVYSFGCEQFPTFYTNDSGIQSPAVLESTVETADVLVKSQEIGLNSGIVVAVPNPKPANSEKINYAVNYALNSAEVNKNKAFSKIHC